MKKRLAVTILLVLSACLQLIAQAAPKAVFPFDPFKILKTWNYNEVLRFMGPLDQPTVKDKTDKGPSVLSYPYEMLGMSGRLSFNFRKDSITFLQFRKDHPDRIVSEELTARMVQDTLVRWEYNKGIQQQDSLRRDSVLRALTAIMGHPLTSGKTPVTERNARFAAVWINNGYSCQYKDYINYSEILFTLSTVQSRTSGEFDIPPGTELIRKMQVKTKKMAWMASLLGLPSTVVPMAYSDYFLLLEFSTGQRFLENLPHGTGDFLLENKSVGFSTRIQTRLNLPNGAIGYLPDWFFDDFDGDAIPDARIQVPTDPEGNISRFYVFTMPSRDPHLVLNTGELLPASIESDGKKRISLVWPDGSRKTANLPDDVHLLPEALVLHPKGFLYFNTTRYNNDGSTNFLGGIDLGPLTGANSSLILEILYNHVSGGWEPSTVTVVTGKK
jgi:hypothetical protein